MRSLIFFTTVAAFIFLRAVHMRKTLGKKISTDFTDMFLIVIMIIKHGDSGMFAWYSA